MVSDRRIDAVNGLVSHPKTPAGVFLDFMMAKRDELERQVDQCRRLARWTTDQLAAEALSKLADELDEQTRSIKDGEDAEG